MANSGPESALASSKSNPSAEPTSRFETAEQSVSNIEEETQFDAGSSETTERIHGVPEPHPPAADRGKIIIALPAYNEAESLLPLLDRIRRAMTNFGRDYHVIVVNDGSQDETALVASQYTFQMDLTLVNHEVNRGFGAAVESGIRLADELAGPNDVIVTMDADNTQPPESIHRMVALIEDGYDVVIASRYRAGARVVGVPLMRNIYSLGARAIFSCMFPTRGVRDYTCGFRAFRATIIRSAVAAYGNQFFSEDGFSTTVDLLLKVRNLPTKVLFYEIPLVLRYDQKEGISKMNVARTIKQTLSLIARRKIGK